MPVGIDISTYCKGAHGWAKKMQLPQTTLDLWDQLCEDRKYFSKDSTKIKIKDLGKAVPEALKNFFMGMLSPESMGSMVALYGVNSLTKKGFAKLVDKLATSRGMTEPMVEALGDLVTEKGASIAAANAGAALTMVLDVAWDEGKYGIVALSTLLKGAEMFGDIIPVLGEIMMIFQLEGMIFDAWDPCDLKKMIDKNTFHAYNDTFNTVFREKVLVLLESHIDPYGNVFYEDSWPIPFYLEDTVFPSYEREKYQAKFMIYSTQYFNAKQVNSLGERINWGKGGTLVNNEIFSKIGSDVALGFAEGNTYAANFILKFSPLILVIVGVVIFLLFRLINGK